MLWFLVFIGLTIAVLLWYQAQDRDREIRTEADLLVTLWRECPAEMCRHERTSR